MALPSSLKSPISLHIFSMKTPSSSSSSSLSSMKLKTLLQTFVFSHMYRITRAFAKAKSVLVELLGGIHFVNFVEFPMKCKSKNTDKQKKLFFGSFRLHYNWCSSHVMPLGQECYSDSHVYYDSSWNTVIPTTTTSSSYDKMEESSCDNEELSKYLKWLEEKGKEECTSSCNGNEIDKLADMFIANCHEKFRLEKQESYRRFQEMMARSV